MTRLITLALTIGILAPSTSYSQVTAYGYYDPQSLGVGFAFIPYQTSWVLGVDLCTDGVLRKVDQIGNNYEEDNLVIRFTPGFHVNVDDRKGGPGMTIMGMLGARRKI